VGGGAGKDPRLRSDKRQLPPPGTVPPRRQPAAPEPVARAAAPARRRRRLRPRRRRASGPLRAPPRALRRWAWSGRGWLCGSRSCRLAPACGSAPPPAPARTVRRSAPAPRDAPFVCPGGYAHGELGRRWMLRRRFRSASGFGASGPGRRRRPRPVAPEGLPARAARGRGRVGLASAWFLLSVFQPFHGDGAGAGVRGHSAGPTVTQAATCWRIEGWSPRRSSSSCGRSSTVPATSSRGPTAAEGHLVRRRVRRAGGRAAEGEDDRRHDHGGPDDRLRSTACSRRRPCVAATTAATRRSRVLRPQQYGAPRSVRTREGFLFPATYQVRSGRPPPTS
jgi:hypothetical protein